MEKFSVLLDETTIVNFRLLWKLFSRYRSHLTIAGIALLFLFSYYYFSQPVVYSTSVPIKIIEKHTVSNDLQSLVQVDGPSTISLNELQVSLSSYTFIKSYAELVVNDPEFKKLNFGSINSGRAILGSTIELTCKNDKKCMVEQLIGPLSGSFSVEQGATENRFLLTLNALTEHTVNHLINVLTRSIENHRVSQRKYIVTKEIESVEKLLKESRDILSGDKGIVVLEDNENQLTEIADLRERMRNISIAINQETSNYTSLEAKVLENKKILKDSSSEEVFTKMTLKTLKNKINTIRQNLTALEAIPESSRSESDMKVIIKLKEELLNLEKNVPHDDEITSLEAGDDFENAQRMREKGHEFDYQVSKVKIDNLKKEYDEVKFKLDMLSKDKIAKEVTVTRLKSDLEFLKTLESKQLSLKLMSTTMTSDLLFEEFSRGTREFRRSSILKIFIFSFLVTGFIYLCSILIRYFWDDRIYSEDDLKTHFIKLDFVGEVPSFD